MPLVSSLFKDDGRLQKCLVSPSAHVQRGDRGVYVGRIQQALIVISNANIPDFELSGQIYGGGTAAAVLDYKSSKIPPIINRSYETRVDDIVGEMTIKALDDDLLGATPTPSPLPPSPGPTPPSPIPPSPRPTPPSPIPPSPKPTPRPPVIQANKGVSFEKPLTFRTTFESGHDGFYKSQILKDYIWQMLPLAEPNNPRFVDIVQDTDGPPLTAVTSANGDPKIPTNFVTCAAASGPNVPRRQRFELNARGQQSAKAVVLALDAAGKEQSRINIRTLPKKKLKLGIVRLTWDSIGAKHHSKRSLSDITRFVSNANKIGPQQI